VSRTRTAPPLEFGIYPGGPVGTIKIKDSPVPEIATSRLAALDTLRAHTGEGTPRPFVVRLYESFTGQPQVDSWTGTGANATADAEITSLSASGFEIDLVVRYEPVLTLGPAAVDDYLTFIRTLVQHYGPNSLVQYLQIANEANVTTSAASSDGAFPGSVQAVVWGVEAAAQEATEERFSHLHVGFNWAYATGAGTGEAIWQFLHSQGLAFRKSVSWVGLDDYPGTFSNVSVPARLTGRTLVRGVAELRKLMSESGLPATIPIHVAETGYPTGPKRTRASQSVALASLVEAVNEARREFDVTDFEWFDLRDSNSSIANVQEQYGLMTDTYGQKTAFHTYERLVAELGQ
jgi:hypothetical protein